MTNIFLKRSRLVSLISLLTFITLCFQQSAANDVPGIRLDDIVIEVVKEESTPPVLDTDRSSADLIDVIWILRQSLAHEEHLLKIRVKLRAGVVALEEERELLKNVREILASQDVDDSDRAWYRQWEKEIEETIAGLEEEREKLLADAAASWADLRLELNDTIALRQDTPAIQRDLVSFRDQLESREQISKLELLFAAGKSAELRALLPAALRNPDLAEQAELIRVGDLLERGKMAEALHASRLGANKYPDNSYFALFQKNLESSYLKAISGKTVDDGARLHALWDEYTEGADRGAAWQLFFGGLKRTYHRATGKSAKMEELAKSGFDRAAMEHNGIELMLRLRKQGLTLDQIQDLDHEALRGWLIKIAPKRGAPSDEIVENFSVALEAAFRNKDVMRLRSPGRTPMRVSDGPYYGVAEFEKKNDWYSLESWGEWVLDGISAKNVLLVFGPAATLSMGSSILGEGGSWILSKGSSKLNNASSLFARLAARLGEGSRAAAAFAPNPKALTIGQWVYSSRVAQSLTAAIAETRAGGVLYQARHVLRELRYHDRTLVRWGTAATGFSAQVAANWLLMEGAGTVGEKLGGEYARVAGELAAGLVGLPGTGSTARLQARMERAQAAVAGVKARMEQAKVIVQLARAARGETEAALKMLRAPVHEAAESLTGKGAAALTAEQRNALQHALKAAEEAAENANNAAGTVRASALVNGAADEASALAASARASLAGRADDALGASQLARAIEGEVDQLGRSLAASEQQIGQTLAEVAENAPASSLKPTRPPRAPGSAPSLIDDPVLPPGKPPDIRGAVDDLVPPAPPGPPLKGSLDDLVKNAEAAKKANEFERAAALLHAASRHPDLPPESRANILASLKEARQAARAKAVLEAHAATSYVDDLAREADQAKQPFDEAQRQILEKIKQGKVDDMPLLPGAGKARRIDGRDGEPLAVWKPGERTVDGLMDKDGQIPAELLMSRLGKKLGLNIPYAEPMKVGDTPGVVIRWIPSSTDLASLSPGAQAALKKQIAAFRPLHTLLGNYDWHTGNIKVDAAGRPWSIDAGNSLLHTPRDGTAAPDEDLILFWTRYLRDRYAKAGKTDSTYRANTRLRELFSGSDMHGSAKKLKEELDFGKIKELLEEAMGSAEYSAEHTGLVLETLTKRHENLSLLLNEIWPGALP